MVNKNNKRILKEIISPINNNRFLTFFPTRSLNTGRGIYIKRLRGLYNHRTIYFRTNLRSRETGDLFKNCGVLINASSNPETTQTSPESFRDTLSALRMESTILENGESIQGHIILPGEDGTILDYKNFDKNFAHELEQTKEMFEFVSASKEVLVFDETLVIHNIDGGDGRISITEKPNNVICITDVVNND